MNGSLWNLLWYIIFPLIGFVFVITAPWLLPLIYFRFIPKAARKLFWAGRRKRPIAIIVHDTGRAAIVTLRELLGEGIVVTDQGKYKILPQYVAIEGNPGEEGEPAEKPKYEKDYRDLLTKRALLTGLDLPMFFGYSGKVCLLNPEALALYEAAEMKIQTVEGKPMFNPRNKRGKSLRHKLQPLMLLDPRKIKDLIGRQFNVSQIGALIVESERIGLLGRGWGRFILPIGLIITAAIIGIILLLAAPSLLSGLGSGMGI